MASKMASPYSRPSPIRVKCVVSRKNTKTLNFKLADGEIRPGTQEITYLSALSTGGQVYITQSSSDRAAFDAEKMAKDALIPPSVSVTGEEQDLFSRGGYISLYRCRFQG